MIEKLFKTARGKLFLLVVNTYLSKHTHTHVKCNNILPLAITIKNIFNADEHIFIFLLFQCSFKNGSQQ